MEVGLVARADDRGLGHMTWEFHRHLRPERTLVVREPGAEARGFKPHLDRYSDALVVSFTDGQLVPEGAVRDWLNGLDVIYSAETFYDWRMIAWAKEAGAATVLHAMPEFYRSDTPQPTAVWAPSPWRLNTLPETTRLVPVPVATDRFPMRPAGSGDRLQVLHVAGHRAALDRNGTLQLAQALRSVRYPMDVRIATQDPRLPTIRARRPVLTVRADLGGVGDYWRLYDNAHVLVMPRRYGGLCLPVQEAMAAGLAVVMTDCHPNRWWPIVPVPAVEHGSLDTAGGRVALHNAVPSRLAFALDQLAAYPGVLAQHQEASVEWARAHSWATLQGLYWTELARAAGMARSASSGFS